MREHTRQAAITAAQQLAENLDTTDPERAAIYLTAALAHDPTNEHTARQLIRHHLTHHQPEAARRVHTQLVRHLADLGLQPAPATTALLDNPTPTTRP